MSQLPPAILLDLDDTILSAFGQAEGQWQRVIAEFIEHLAPHPPDPIYIFSAKGRFLNYAWDPIHNIIYAARMGRKAYRFRI